MPYVVLLQATDGQEVWSTGGGTRGLNAIHLIRRQRKNDKKAIFGLQAVSGDGLDLKHAVTICNGYPDLAGPF